MDRIRSVIASLDAARQTDNVRTDGAGVRPGPGDLAEGTVPEGDRFTVLKNERRRQALQVLDLEDGSSTLSRMAERIAGWENGIDPSVLDAQQRKRVYVALYQRHLPRMDDKGVVEFEQRSGRVRLTERGRQLMAWSRRARDRAKASAADAWAKRYMAVGAAGVVALVTALVAGVPAAWSTTAILGATLLVSIAHVTSSVTSGGGQ